MEFTLLSGIITLSAAAIAGLAGLSFKKPAITRNIIRVVFCILAIIYGSYYVSDLGVENGLNTKISVVDSVTKKMLKYGIVYFSKGKVDTIISASSDSIAKSPQDLVLKYNIEDSIDTSVKNKLTDIYKRRNIIGISFLVICIMLFFLNYLTFIVENHNNNSVKNENNDINNNAS